MRQDFVHHYSETGFKSHRSKSNPNPRIQTFRNQKPRLNDLVYDEESDEYDIAQERNLFKHSKTTPVGTLEWGDSKYYRWRMVSRFLQSRVGSFWNDVYSEVCVNKDNDVHFDSLKRNIKSYVQTETFMNDGKVCAFDYRKRIVEVQFNVFWRNEFYVHPVTGKLCCTEHDFLKIVNPRSREQNKILFKHRMITQKNMKREKKLRIGRFTHLNWRTSKTNTTLEDAMRILKEKKNEGK
jgi:hypothetical protein